MSKKRNNHIPLNKAEREGIAIAKMRRYAGKKLKLKSELKRGCVIDSDTAWKRKCRITNPNKQEKRARQALTISEARAINQRFNKR